MCLILSRLPRRFLTQKHILLLILFTLLQSNNYSAVAAILFFFENSSTCFSTHTSLKPRNCRILEKRNFMQIVLYGQKELEHKFEEDVCL